LEVKTDAKEIRRFCVYSAFFRNNHQRQAFDESDRKNPFA